MADQSPPSHSPNSVSNEAPNIVVEYADSLNVKEMVVKSCQGMKLKTVFMVFNAALRAINKCENEVAIGTEMIEYFNEQFGRRWNCIVENHGGIPEPWVGDDDYIVFMAKNTHFSLYRTQAVRSPNRSRSPKSGESVCSNHEEVDSMLVSYPNKTLTIHSCYEMHIMMIVCAFNSMLELPDNDIDVLVNRLKTLFDQVYIGHGHWMCVAGSAFLTANPPDWTGAELLVCSVGDKMICLYRASKQVGGSGNEPGDGADDGAGDGADDGADDDEEAGGDGDEPSLTFYPNDEEQDNSSEDDESISESDDDEGEEKNNTCEEYESNSYIDAEEEQEEYDTTEGHDSTSEFDEVEGKEEIDTSEEDEEDTEFDDEEEQAENSINEEEEYGDNENESEAHNEEEVYDTTSEEEEYGDNEASDESKSDNEEEDNTDSEEEEYGDNEASDESKSDNEEEDNTDSEEEEYGDEASDEEDDD